MTASWGSPYSTEETNLIRRESIGSDQSEGSPIHHIAISTPFLRPPPALSLGQDESHEPYLSAAQVLANRARRPARRLTEDWIRQHTAGDHTESRHWFSDGSEHSSLSGSGSGDEAVWHDKESLRTPRARPRLTRASLTEPRYPRTRSSVETLKQEDVKPRDETISAKMESPDLSKADLARELPDLPPIPTTPRRSASAAVGNTARTPTTPMRSASARVTIKEPSMTPRVKKKIPWKGKNIMVLLPKDEERGRPGHAPKPLNQNEIEGMFRSWEELGYDISGFDLDLAEGTYQAPTGYSQSRDAWPSPEDLVRERAQHTYKVTLPDLNGKPALKRGKAMGTLTAVQLGETTSMSLTKPSCELLECHSATTILQRLQYRLQYHSPADRPLRNIRLCHSPRHCLHPQRRAITCKAIRSRHSSYLVVVLLRATVTAQAWLRPLASAVTLPSTTIDSRFQFPWATRLSRCQVSHRL